MIVKRWILGRIISQELLHVVTGMRCRQPIYYAVFMNKSSIVHL